MRFFKSAASLALAAFTAFAAAQSTKGNAITAPGLGAVIEAGKTFTIKWMNTVGSDVKLVIMAGEPNSLKPVYTIVESTPNTGSYSWTVPQDVPAGTSYSIRISYDSNPNDFNYSDRFALNSQTMSTASVSSASTTTTVSTSVSTSVSTVSTTGTETSSTTMTMTSASITGSTTVTTSRRTTSAASSSASPSSTSAPPPSAGNSNLSSPLAVIMAFLAAALFLHY